MLRQDFVSALRFMRRNPLFSFIVIASLALGIGANTAIFSVVNGVLLRPLAIDEPDRVFAVTEMVPKFLKLYPQLPVNPRHADEWAKHAPGIEGLALAQSGSVVLTERGAARQLVTKRVTANYLPVLGMQPRVGRNFRPEEMHAGKDSVVILTDSTWRGQFGARSDIVGSNIRLNGKPYQVIGVLPRDLDALPSGALSSSNAPQMLVPLELKLEDSSWMFDYNYEAIARLKRGVPAGQAAAQINSILTNIEKTFPEKIGVRAELTPLKDFMTGSSRKSLFLLLAAVGAVLLIVCLNLAILLLARATARDGEAAIRVALGASRWAVLRQALAETLLLAGIGGLAGAWLAYVCLDSLVALAPSDLPRLGEVHVDPVVLLFAMAITLIAGVVCGLWPAFHQSRQDPLQAMRAVSRSTTEGRASLRGKGALIAFETALSTLLLILSGLLVNSFLRAMHQNSGFQAEHAFTATIDLRSEQYRDDNRRNQFFHLLTEKLRSAPGATAVGLASHLPLQGETWIDMVSLPSDTRPESERPSANFRFIDSGYFRAMGIPILAGRPISDSDRGKHVMVVSEGLAHRFWPNQNPIGQTLVNSDEGPIQVIGVAGDTRAELTQQPPVIVYSPYWKISPGTLNLIVRTAGDPRAVMSGLKRMVSEVEPEAAVSRMRTLQDVLTGSVAQRRFQVYLTTVFALAALVLVSLGVFGVVAFSVNRRRVEIGIRLALGASTANVRRLMVLYGMTPVVIGAGAGALAALAMGPVVRSLLFEVKPTDSPTFAIVICVLLTVAAVASYLPAMRATQSDPNRILRYE